MQGTKASLIHSGHALSINQRDISLTGPVSVDGHGKVTVGHTTNIFQGHDDIASRIQGTTANESWD